MASDTTWDAVRNALVAVGTAAAASGYFGISADQVGPFVDNALIVAGAASAVGAFAWSIYVKFRTKAVPIEVAARADVPTVNPITGAIKYGSGVD